MSNFELVMPKMGESIMEATILKWLKKPGDSISLDEAVLEIATDKVDSEVPSPAAGVLKEILFAEGDVVPSICYVGEYADHPPAKLVFARRGNRTGLRPQSIQFVTKCNPGLCGSACTGQSNTLRKS